VVLVYHPTDCLWVNYSSNPNLSTPFFPTSVLATPFLLLYYGSFIPLTALEYDAVLGTPVVPKVTYCVSGGTLNHTRSLTPWYARALKVT